MNGIQFEAKLVGLRGEFEYLKAFNGLTLSVLEDLQKRTEELRGTLTIHLNENLANSVITSEIENKQYRSINDRTNTTGC